MNVRDCTDNIVTSQLTSLDGETYNSIDSSLEIPGRYKPSNTSPNLSRGFHWDSPQKKMTVAVSMGNDNINSTKTTQSVVRKLGLHRLLYTIHSFILHRVLYSLILHGVLYALSLHRVLYALSLHRVLYAISLHRVLYAISLHRVLYTLRASLSGTLLQTLPDLVTPLKGYSLSPRSCPVTRSAPSERFLY